MKLDNDNENKKSWLERLASALTGEPKNQNDLLEVIKNAEDKDIIEAKTLAMIEGVFEIVDMHVVDIMIPKSKMVVIPHNLEAEKICELAINSGHSRFPVIGETKDDIMGILLAKDLLPYTFKNKDPKEFNIQKLLRPAVIIPESKRVIVLLNEFRENRNHLAIIVDEYGNISGLVTIEDILEQIVGNIVDEYDIDEKKMITKNKDGSYKVKAQTPINHFNKILSVELDDSEFDTIGGIVANKFGRLPKANEKIIMDNLNIQILSSDARKINLLKIIKE
tara:strand:+ start:2055 stop:2891 length:837 start_codon:yes stop_codon:yes gene_type:complete